MPEPVRYCEFCESEQCECSSEEDDSDDDDDSVESVVIESDEELPTLESGSDTEEEEDSVVAISKTTADSHFSSEVAGHVTRTEATAEPKVFKVTLQNKRILLIKAKQAEVSEAKQPAYDDAEELAVLRMYASGSDDPLCLHSQSEDEDDENKSDGDDECDHIREPEVTATRLEGETLLLTPELAQQWQQLTFEQFLQSVPVKRLRGLDRNAWTQFHANHKEKTFNMETRERKVLTQDTPFAKHLAEWNEELQLPILPSKFNLPNVLRDLQNDDHPKAAEVYINLSRGAIVLPQEAADSLNYTEVENYRPKNELLKRQRLKEMQRHFDEGFVQYWEDLGKEHGKEAIGEPRNIHALGTQPKNEQVCRLTLDASGRSLDPGQVSVNEAAPDYPCHYPKYQHVTSAMSRTGCIARADDSDAFLLIPIRPSQYKHTCCRDPRNGRIMAFRRLPLGFKASAAIQQNILVAHIRAFRRLLRQRGLRTAGKDPVFEKPWPYIKPNPKGHELSASPGYSDDVGLVNTSWASGWFSMIIFLMMKFEWGIKQGFKEGKTDGPAIAAMFIGFLFNCRAMTLALHEERLIKMRTRLKPFALKDPECERTIGEGRSLIGVLIFACAVVLLGKAFLAGALEVVQIADRKTPGQKAPDSQPWKGSKESRHDARMWYNLLETMTVRSACIGIRRRKFPFPAFSDASFAGWCWACMGILRSGVYPEEWKDKIGHHSELREIFITELETFCVVLIAREIFPRCRGMIFEGYADNIGTVYMVNKLSTRSKRTRPMIHEILWRAAAYDVEIHYDHVPTERNSLTDAGTRIKDKDFASHVKAFEAVHTKSWCKAANEQFPPQPAARPELVDKIPIVHEGIFDSLQLDLRELAVMAREWQQFGANADNRDAAAAFMQGDVTKGC